ncbi:MAG: phosphate ABC transporter ATP-binding protein [Bacillota bacterium]
MDQSKGAKISAQEFSFAYGTKQALKKVTLSVPEHQLLTLMGPNGGGKTTLMRALNRLNDLVVGTSREGQLLLDGIDVYGSKTHVSDLRRRVGMVFALPYPLPMSIYENVAYGPRKKGISSRAQIDDLVEQSLRDAILWDEVKDRLRDSAVRLSGGQQQRLAIARVIAVAPEVILLDEPTSGLDPISTLRIEELMNRLTDKYTVILATPNPQQAARVGGEVAFLLEGELIEKGPAQGLFTGPRDKRTEDYITGKFG